MCRLFNTAEEWWSFPHQEVLHILTQENRLGLEVGGSLSRLGIRRQWGGKRSYSWEIF